MDKNWLSQLDRENHFFYGANRRGPTERSRIVLVYVFIGHFGGILDYGELEMGPIFPLAALCPVFKIKDRGTKYILGEQRAREPKKVEIEVIMTGGPKFTPCDRQTDSTPREGQISITSRA